MPSVETLVNRSAKCRDEQYFLDPKVALTHSAKELVSPSLIFQSLFDKFSVVVKNLQPKTYG